MAGKRKLAERRTLATSAERRAVTFEKRRATIFKEASELLTLCNPEMVLVVFSPNGEAYSFGNPSVESVMDRYMNSVKSESDPSRGEDNLPKLQQLDVARKQGVEPPKIARDKSLANRPDGELRLEVLKELKAKLLDLKEEIKRFRALSLEQAASDLEADNAVGGRKD